MGLPPDSLSWALKFIYPRNLGNSLGPLIQLRRVENILGGPSIDQVVNKDCKSDAKGGMMGRPID